MSLDVSYNPKRTSNPRPRVQDNVLALTSKIHSGSHHIGHGHCHMDIAADQVAAAEPVLMAIDLHIKMISLYEYML